MAHKPAELMQAQINTAESLISIGSLYTHYKDLTHQYRVMGFCILESTDEIAVLYQALYENHFTFVRPVSSWSEEVAYNGVLVSRFTMVESTDA